jgi:hypothetical protein
MERAPSSATTSTTTAPTPATIGTAAPGGAAAPTVRQVTPTELQAGNTYTLALSGTNLQPTMQIDFGSGILVQKGLTVSDAGHAQVTVQVAAAAAAGRYPITVTYTPRATLAALPTVKTQGPGYVDVQRPPANGAVVLDRVSPAQVAQGQQATLTLMGSGFSAGMGVSFGPGITAAGPVVVQTPNLATLSIVVAAQAPAIPRQPTLVVASKDTKVSPEATLTVTAANVVGIPKPAPAPVAVASTGGNVPMLLTVSPGRLFTGQSYTLTLRGVDLVPQLNVDLGEGITATGGLRIQSPSLATLDVVVAGTAAPGMRWLGLRAPSALVPVREDASVLVQRSPPTGQGFAPVQSACHVALVAQQGSIALDAPVYTGYTDDFGGHYNVPVLNDQTVFSWHEANPGLADRYELRFYSGATLIASRVLTAAPGYALPHSLTADAALIAELTSKVGGRAAQIVRENLPEGAPAPSFHWDISWQVVGSKTYYDNCTSGASLVAGAPLRLNPASLGPGNLVQVEHSETVPISQPKQGDPLLDLSAAPTGLACNSAPPGAPQRRAFPIGRPGSGSGAGSGAASAPAAPASNLLLTNVSRTSQSNNRTGTGDFVGDQWQFSGQFDLSNAPWAIESQKSVNAQNPGYPIETEALNNVFVDWGDGSIEPLTIQWKGQYCGNLPCFASNNETSTASQFNLDQATNPSAFGHAYGEAGSFTVRVYMLPASAVQQHGALPSSLQAGSGGLYGHLMTRMSLSGAAGSAADAYMLTCQAVNIQHRTDPVSNGPLKLVAIHLTGWPNAPSGAPGSAPSGAASRILDTARGSGMARAANPASPAAASATVPATPSPAVAPDGAATVAEVPRAGPLLRIGAGTGAAPSAPPPQFSSCDDNLIGGASVDFYGQGTIRLDWYLDGQSVGSSEEPIGPSQSRTDAQLTPPTLAPPLQSSWGGLHSPALSLAQETIGNHSLMVTASVVEDTTPCGNVMEALHTYADAGTAASQSRTPPQQSASLSSQSAALANAPPLGVLGPRGAVSAGLPPIAWVKSVPAGAPGVSLPALASARSAIALPPSSAGGHPPDEVQSAPASYQTTSANPALPCTFNFPVTGGKFVLSGLQHGGAATVQQQGGRYSGTAVLQAQFADASGTSTQPEPVTIHLNGWTLQPDGVTVASGSFDERPAVTMHVPGLNATLERMTGTAGAQVQATLTAAPVNTDIVGTNGQAPGPWTHVASTLSPAGDWYADQLPLSPLLVYDSGFSLTAANATLDLSQVDGQGASAACQGGTGKSWMGVLLNQARLTAFNFDLPNPPTATAAGWALDSYGFCGSANFPSGSASLDRGSISWNGIAANASQGSFSANYNALKVHVPWLNVDLTSPQATTQLTAGRNAGAGGINLNLTSPSSVTVSEGPVSLTASNLSFASLPNAGGWAVKSDTSVTFTAQQGTFASGVVLHGLDYGMNGAATFADGSSSRHLNLAGQRGNIGGSLVDLKSVDVEVGAPSSPMRLAFAFDSTLTISKALPAADVTASYSISQAGSGNYGGAGPITSPFTIDKPFPDANPSVHLNMQPTYVGPGSGGSPPSSGIVFSSNLNLAMFGGPPVSGQFVLGYIGSDDYWIAKAVLDLGPTGVEIVPPIVNLYQVGGGMGYNVSLDSFKNTDLTRATPQDDGTLLFDATLLVGSPDHSTFGLLGDFTIKPGGQDPGGRMDYQAWLLSSDWSGSSPITGYFSYSGGVFDGTLNAQLSLLNDQVAIDATNNAIHLHMGGGQWYYHFGTQSNPLNGHLFFYHGKAWADLGSDGFGLGLISRLDIDAGDCGGVCAYVHDDWTVATSITPSPLSFSAQASDSFNLGACADNLCLSANASAAVSLSLPPPYLDFSFGLGSCPPGKIDVGLQVLPSIDASVGGHFCL